MDDDKYCRVCLVTDVKMCSLNKPPIRDAYLRILQLTSLASHDQYVCYECESLLHKFWKFQLKCLRSQEILVSLGKDNTQITKHLLKFIDRKQSNLLSGLCTLPAIISTCPSLEIFQDECEDKLCPVDIKVEFDSEVQQQKVEGSEMKEIPINTISDEIANGEQSDNSIDDSNFMVLDILSEDNNISDDSIDNDSFIRDIRKHITRSTDDSFVKKSVLKDITKNVTRSTDDSTDTESILGDIGKHITQFNNDNTDKESILKDIKKHINKIKKETFPKKKKSKRKKVKDEFDSDTDDLPLAKAIRKQRKRKMDNEEKIDRRVTFNAKDFEDYATVVILTPDEARKEVLLRKESSNYKNCSFKCELCFRGYEAEKAFENHMKKHSEDYGLYECEYCHLRFPKQRFLCKHRLSSHKRKFYCKICPYTSFCTYQARTHMSLHQGKRYPCDDCGELFSMPNSLLMHKRVKHKFVTEYICPMCGSHFGSQRGLFAHSMLIHRQEKNEFAGPKCDDCDIHFANELAWKRHLVLSSKHAISNGCEFCGDTFPDEEALKAHVRVHARRPWLKNSVKVPATCVVCDKWCADRNEYREHLTSEHPDSAEAKKLEHKNMNINMCVCEICGKMFKKQCFLLYHQRKHTGERPYKCEQCGKTYVFPGALSTHRATHRKVVKTHKCDMCDKMFRFRSALNKHVKAHLGIRPHKCAICDKGFPNPCDVKVHMKYVHYKVPWPKRDRSKRTNTTVNDV